MSKSKHTPGPWFVMEGIADGGGIAIGPELHGVGPHALITFTGGESEANALLIAAAPELLKAMPTIPHPGGALVKVVAHYEDGSTQTIDGAIVSAAVAKATGSK